MEVTEVILAVLLTLVIGAISLWYAVYYKYERYLGKYPGPQLLPILGAAHHFKNLEGMSTLTDNYSKQKKFHVGKVG